MGDVKQSCENNWLSNYIILKYKTLFSTFSIGVSKLFCSSEAYTHRIFDDKYCNLFCSCWNVILKVCIDIEVVIVNLISQCERNKAGQLNIKFTRFKISTVCIAIEQAFVKTKNQ